jgi:hypothetical protein
MTGNDDEEQSPIVLNQLMDESVLQGSSHKIVVPDARRGGVDLKPHTVTNYGLKERPTDVTSQVLADICAAAQEDGMVAKIFWTEEQRTSELDILNELTSEVRWLLGFPEPKKSSHALYVLVFRRLRPITELHDKDLFNVWRQCVLCTWFVVSVWLPAKIMCMVGHFDLWQGGVYHRDVSPPPSNLIGVLNDYDLSSLRTQGPQGNERMGTVPFVALNLLTRWGHRGEVKHLYRHDLGSFMWVLVWVCLRYRDGKLLRLDRPLDAWAINDTETVYKKKTIFLYSFWNFKPRGVDQEIHGVTV